MTRRVPAVVLICVALSALPLNLSAQGVVSGAVTLDAAMQRAVTANPSLMAARLRRATDAAGVAVAQERPNPVELRSGTRAPHMSLGAALPIELGGKRGRHRRRGRHRAGDDRDAGTSPGSRDAHAACVYTLAAAYQRRDRGGRARDRATRG
jgi:hypothetical protein